MKKIISTAFIIVLALLCFSSCEEDRGALNELPLSELKATDIASFKLTINPPNYEGTFDGKEEIAELVGLLKDLVIYDRDNPLIDYYGQWVQFDLTFADGGVNTVAAFASQITIGEIAYKAEYAPCEALNAFANRVAGTSYAK